MFKTKPSGNKTSSVGIGLNIRAHASPEFINYLTMTLSIAFDVCVVLVSDKMKLEAVAVCHPA